ncbi:MAG: Cobalamin-binding protein precursor [Methanosaeta sp. PtaU1.Bin112]|nr:MAG: Cobalamin-binding protein precursor [Methanosaeta sp. PtaU1.Bin112]
MRNVNSTLKSMLLYLAILPMICSLTLADENTTSVPTIVDDPGKSVSLAQIPQRIISLSPSNTEILFALGLGDNVVGATKYCDYPPLVNELKESKKIEVVGGYVDPDIEMVLSLHPDLVLASRTRSTEAVTLLDKEGIATLVSDPKNLTDIIRSIEKIGKITGKEEEASKLCNQMQSRIDAISEKTSSLGKMRVLYIVWHDPVKTAGAGTFEDELIEKAGGVNIFHDLSGYAQVDPEAIAVRNPEVIIACSGMGSGADEPTQWAKTERGLNQTIARKNDRIYKAEGDLITRAGPRIVDGLEMMAKFIHPEAF